MSYDSGSNYKYPPQKKKETKIKDYELTPFDKEVMHTLSGTRAESDKELSEVKQYPVMIKCPSCDTVQAAIYEDTIPFGTYIHHCCICKYVIMESEWDEIKPFKFARLNSK